MRLKNNRGMTIIELLIYMGLLSLILITFTDLFVATFSTKLEAESNFRIEEDGKYILARLMYDIARSDSITTPASQGSSSGTLVTTIGGVNYSYNLSGGNLILSNNLGTNFLNGSETTITSLNFKRLGNTTGKNSIKFDFTVQSKISRKGGNDSQSFNSVAGIR